MKNKMLVGAGLSVFALALTAKDAVIMTVNGVDVPQSEFEYLYNKNSQQQLNPQSIDDYVEMFKLYKLKVADARSEGLDTLTSFRKEMEQYKRELAAPYLTDSTYIYSLLDEAHGRAAEEVEATHIMLFKTRDENENARLRQRADSIREAVVNGADFAETAKKFSGDRGSKDRGGRMGWITAQQYPYDFETAAYRLSDGEISEVVESPMGYHILKGGKHRPARGKVQVAHILLMTQNLDDTKQAEAKARIDSLYTVAAADPEKFADLARQYSDDKGSGRQGGMLPWFGAGEMVEEFDSVSFSLPDGALSKPFKSKFGWHIVKKYGSKATPTVEEMKPAFMASVGSPQDPRFRMIRRHQNDRLAKAHKASIDAATLKALNDDLATAGLDSAYVAKWTTAPLAQSVICTIDGKTYPAGEFISRLKTISQPNASAAARILDSNLESYYNNLLVNAEEDALLQREPDYANLYREYYDGSLLYEVSVRKVWDKASKDKEGLAKYFERNRGNYTWTEPRAKGYLVQTVNDSVAALVRARAAELGRDTLVNTLRKEFPRQISITKVLEPKGSNGMIDNIVFGGPEVKPASQNYTVYFMIDPRVISAPEEVGDVNGLVTSDYQNEFQNAWEEELRRKYPVKVNEKVLKKIRKKSK